MHEGLIESRVERKIESRNKKEMNGNMEKGRYSETRKERKQG